MINILGNRIVNREVFDPDLVPLINWSSFAFTRASTATYIDSAGNRQTAAIDVKRLDWTDGVEKLLVESASKNLYLNSDILVTQDVTIAYVFTVVSFYGTGSITFSGIATGTLTGTGVNDRVYIVLDTSATGTLTSTVSGTVTEAQCEQWAAVSGETLADYYPTSYIPTTTATVKREDELLNYLTISPVITTEFTLFADFNKYGRLNNSGYYFYRLSSSDGADYIQFTSSLGVGRIYWSIAGTIGVAAFDNGLQYPNIMDIGFQMKLAFVGSGTTVRVFLNGEEANDYATGLPILITGFTGIANLTDIYMKSADIFYGNYHGMYKEMRLSNSAITDVEANLLTTI